MKLSPLWNFVLDRIFKLLYCAISNCVLHSNCNNLWNKMKKQGKNFHDHLQNSSWILITEFNGEKNLLLTQHKLARVAPWSLKHGFVRSFWRSRMQRTRLSSSLVMLGHNHRCCELQGSLFWVLEWALSFRIPEFWGLEWHKGLTESTRMHKRYGRRQKLLQGRQHGHFSYPFQVADDVMQTDVHQTLYPFYTTRKMSRVTATVTEIALHGAAILFTHASFLAV